MATASSTFDDSETPLSESLAWTSGPGSAFDVQKVSGDLRLTTLGGGDNMARYEAVTFGSNQYSRITPSERSGWSRTWRRLPRLRDRQT